MLTVCHISDIHLGYRKYSKLTKNGLNQREVDVSLAFRESIDRLITLKPHIVLIAGDLFHSVRPSNTVVTFCFREIRRLQLGTGAQIVIIAGNHETPKRVDSGCITRLIGEIPGVHIADAKQERFSFPDLECSVCAVPHAALATLDEKPIRADDRFTYNLLVTHGQIGERWISDFGGVTLDLQKLSPHEWDYVALGHVHLVRQVALNCWYAGSIEHTANNIWAEGKENKGFLEIRLPEQKVTFHPLTSPREVLVLETIDGKGLDPEGLLAQITQSLNEVPGSVEGKIIRLEVENVPREIYRQLNHKALRPYRTAALHLALDIRPPAASGAVVTLSGSKKMRLEDSLKEFCATWEGADLQTIAAVQPLVQGYLEKLEETDEAPTA